MVEKRRNKEDYGPRYGLDQGKERRQGKERKVKQKRWVAKKMTEWGDNTEKTEKIRIIENCTRKREKE